MPFFSIIFWHLWSNLKILFCQNKAYFWVMIYFKWFFRLPKNSSSFNWKLDGGQHPWDWPIPDAIHQFLSLIPPGGTSVCQNSMSASLKERPIYKRWLGLLTSLFCFLRDFFIHFFMWSLLSKCVHSFFSFKLWGTQIAIYISKYFQMP